MEKTFENFDDYLESVVREKVSKINMPGLDKENLIKQIKTGIYNKPELQYYMKEYDKLVAGIKKKAEDLHKKDLEKN